MKYLLILFFLVGGCVSTSAGGPSCDWCGLKGVTYKPCYAAEGGCKTGHCICCSEEDDKCCCIHEDECKCEAPPKDPTG